MLRHTTSRIVSPPVGEGLYSATDIARWLHVQPAVVRRWTRAVAQATLRGTGTSAEKKHRKQSAWSFLELIDLLFVERFVAAGMTLREIAAFARDAAVRIGTDHPFATKRFKCLVATPQVAKSRNGSNQAAPGILDEFAASVDLLAAVSLFGKLDFNATTHAQRYWPLGRKGRVVLDPKRKFGRPIDASTRVLTETLFDAVRAGGGQDANVVAEWFDVPLESVQAAVRFERELPGK